MADRWEFKYVWVHLERHKYDVPFPKMFEAWQSEVDALGAEGWEPVGQVAVSGYDYQLGRETSWPFLLMKRRLGP